jgi:hypothetical protein
VQPLPAAANPLEDIARQITRPSDNTPLDAAVALLDARATLRDMSSLVSSSTQEHHWIECKAVSIHLLHAPLKEQMHHAGQLLGPFCQAGQIL